MLKGKSTKKDFQIIFPGLFFFYVTKNQTLIKIDYKLFFFVFNALKKKKKKFKSLFKANKSLLNVKSLLLT